MAIYETILLEGSVDRGVFLEILERIRGSAKSVGHGEGERKVGEEKKRELAGRKVSEGVRAFI